MRFARIFDTDESCCVPGQLEGLGHDQGDRLTAVLDLVVVQRSERGADGGHLVPVATVEPGKPLVFSCVKTWSTPGSASASPASMVAIVPFATSLDTT
jgi:hypothetical protein